MKSTIAIDLGGTIIKIGLLNNGQILERVELKAQSANGLANQLPELELSINQLLIKHMIGAQDISGIGFSFAGLVDSAANRILSTNQKYDDGPSIDLVGWAKTTWGWPLFAENDARMALLGEWQYGAGIGSTELVMVTLGTGIGTAVLMDGKLLKGKHFQAGNLGGHLVVDHKGHQCTCGNIGCVEAEASTWCLPALIKAHPRYSSSRLFREETLDFKTLFMLAQNKDGVAMEVLDHCLSVWSAGIISMIHAFDPEQIILSGGIMKSADMIIPVMQKKVNELAWTPWGKVKLFEAKFPDSAALYGAHYLVNSSITNS